MARIRVLLFAALADAAGLRETSLDVADGAAVGDLPSRLAETFPKLRPLCANVAFAVNAEYAAPGRPLREGDEVALIPPVSGGSHV